MDIGYLWKYSWFFLVIGIFRFTIIVVNYFMGFVSLLNVLGFISLFTLAKRDSLGFDATLAINSFLPRI